MKLYKARCTKDIFWKNKYYYIGDMIELSEEDIIILAQANVIVQLPIEMAVIKPPENRKYKKRRFYDR